MPDLYVFGGIRNKNPDPDIGRLTYADDRMPKAFAWLPQNNLRTVPLLTTTAHQIRAGYLQYGKGNTLVRCSGACRLWWVLLQTY